MSFDKLMAELQEEQQAQEALSKALPAEDGTDDQTIQAAAGEGGAQGEGGTDDNGGGAEVKDKDGKPMAKSFKVKLDDGTEVEATDGAELIKSLTERLDAGEATMAKAMEQVLGLVKGQSAMIKSLSEQVTKLRGEGRGRKAVVTLTERNSATEALNKSEPQTMKGEEFMAKAMSAFNAGKITGGDIALIEACTHRGEQPPAGLVQAVLL